MFNQNEQGTFLTEAAAKQIINKVLDISTAGETEVFFGGGHSALTRFAENHIRRSSPCKIIEMEHAFIGFIR